MDPGAQRFEEYVSLIANQLGHRDRLEPFGGYCTGCYAGPRSMRALSPERLVDSAALHYPICR